MTNQEANAWHPKQHIQFDSEDRSATEVFSVTSATQSEFTLQTFSYAMRTQSLQVYKNGLLLNPETDWAEQTSTSFVLLPAAVSGDEIIAIAATGVTGTINLITDEIPDEVIFLTYTSELANYEAPSTTTGIAIRTNYFDSNQVTDGGAILLPTGTIDGSKSGQVPASDGYFYSSNGHQFKIKGDCLLAKFGARLDGATDDYSAWIAALAFARGERINLLIGDGITALATQVPLLDNGIAIIGNSDQAPQQGSLLPSSSIRWTGGASSMFLCSGSYYRFLNFSVENRGSATDWLQVTIGQHYVFEGLDFTIGNGASRFSRSIIRSDGNEIGYSTFQDCEVGSSAPKFIDIDGQGSSNGITPIKIFDCVFETNALGAMTVLHIKDENFDIIEFRSNTFNQQGDNELLIVDCSDSPVSGELISTLVFASNELDMVTAVPAHRNFKLTNVKNCQFVGNQLALGGSMTAMADLVNSNITACHSNSLFALNGPLFNCDSTSQVFAGANQINLGNTKQIVNDDASMTGVIDTAYGSTVTIQGHLGDPSRETIYRIDVTNTNAWTLSLEHPGVGGSSYFVRGQIISVMVRNVSGGAAGAINPVAGSTYYKLAGGVFPVPANNHSRTVTFVWNGVALVEIHRTEADIPN